jgi:putative Mn2+ efflux pump MntP
MQGGTLRNLIVKASKIAAAFSISTALLPLLGWLVGLAIYEWIAPFSAWVVLIVFSLVGLRIIREALEDERHEVMERVSSFWAMAAMGTLASIDEGAVGISYPFLGIPVLWIVIAVILANTVLISLAALLSDRIRDLSGKLPSILSGVILIILGILEFLNLALGI